MVIFKNNLPLSLEAKTLTTKRHQQHRCDGNVDYAHGLMKLLSRWLWWKMIKGSLSWTHQQHYISLDPRSLFCIRRDDKKEEKTLIIMIPPLNFFILKTAIFNSVDFSTTTAKLHSFNLCVLTSGT